MHSRPTLFSQSSAELLLSLIPERESPVQAVLAALRQHDIPRPAVYALHPNQALLLDSITMCSMNIPARTQMQLINSCKDMRMRSQTSTNDNAGFLRNGDQDND